MVASLNFVSFEQPPHLLSSFPGLLSSSSSTRWWKDAVSAHRPIGRELRVCCIVSDDDDVQQSSIPTALIKHGIHQRDWFGLLSMLFQNKLRTEMSISEWWDKVEWELGGERHKIEQWPAATMMWPLLESPPLVNYIPTIKKVQDRRKHILLTAAGVQRPTKLGSTILVKKVLLLWLLNTSSPCLRSHVLSSMPPIFPVPSLFLTISHGHLTERSDGACHFSFCCCCWFCWVFSNNWRAWREDLNGRQNRWIWWGWWEARYCWVETLGGLLTMEMNGEALWWWQWHKQNL